MRHTAGRFTVDPEAGTVEGPADYLDSKQYRDTLAQITAGRHVVVNYPSGQPVGMRIAVALQTDYAGFRGAKEFFASFGGAR